MTDAQMTGGGGGNGGGVGGGGGSGGGGSGGGSGGGVGGLGVTVGYGGGRVSLVVVGEVDLATAADLGGIVDAVIDAGHRVVVFDLVGLEFMGAAGLAVIAAAVRRVGVGAVVVRSPSALVAAMLEVTGLSAVLQVEAPRTGPGQPGADQPAPAGTVPPAPMSAVPPAPMSAVPPAPMSAVPPAPMSAGASVSAGSVSAGGLAAGVVGGRAGRWREVTAVPADHDVVDGALRLVVALALATVGGADGVSVSLRRHGRLATVAASDETILEMDAEQYATGEGPCVDASVTGRWFHVGSLDGESRWPAFTPRAAKLGINAILSSPLLVDRAAVGALNIYSRSTGAFAPAGQQLAALFAAEASTVLRDAGADLDSDAVAGRITEALAARKIIAQAEGVIMARDGLGADDAYRALRRLSIRHDRPLAHLAATVVASTRKPPTPLGAPRRPADG